MCKASNDYYDAHGYPTDNHEHKDKQNGPKQAMQPVQRKWHRDKH